jgi:hypothetical protein
MGQALNRRDIMGVVRTADGTMSQQAVNELIDQRSNRYGDAYVMGHGDTFWAVLIEPDIVASQGFVLVDLSDIANFPHTETGKIRLYRLDVDIERGEAAVSGEYIVHIGVILEVDATDGSTSWILDMFEETDEESTDDAARTFRSYKWDEGLDLEIGGGALVWGISNAGDTADNTWQTDVPLDSPAGAAASAPGVGDLVMMVEETGGTGSLSISVTVQYITEGV